MTTTITTAFILAGGLGTRLRTLFPETPKPLVPIGDEPFLVHLVRSLARQGLTEFVVSLGYRAEDFASTIQTLTDEGYRVSTIVENRPLGTGGALKLARPHLADRAFLLVNGDTYFEGSLANLLSSREEALVTLGAAFVEDSWRYGRVSEENGRVHFAEKGLAGAGWVNAGLAVCQPEIFHQLPDADSFSLEKDVFEQKSESLRLVKMHGRFFDLGLPSSYASFQLDWVLRNASPEERAYLSTFWNAGRIWVSQSFSQKLQSLPNDRISVTTLPVMDSPQKWLHRSEARDLVILSQTDEAQIPPDISARVLFIDDLELIPIWESTLRKWRMLQFIENIDFPLLSPSYPALFLSREGTLLENTDPSNHSSITLKPGVISLLKEAISLGWSTICIANESRLGEELMSFQSYNETTKKLRHLLISQGAEVELFALSPHSPNSQRAFGLMESSLGSPHPGLILSCAKHTNADLKNSVFVAQDHRDLVAAERAGIGRRILLSSGRTLDEQDRLTSLNIEHETIQSLPELKLLR